MKTALITLAVVFGLMFVGFIGCTALVAGPVNETIEDMDAVVNTDGSNEPDQAVRAAESYLKSGSFSRQGLIDQLEFSNYPVDVATAAVDSIVVDWNAEAIEAAQGYIDTMPFSWQGLVDQLSSSYGNKFTVEQATIGADAVLPR